MAFGDIISCSWTTPKMHSIEIGNAQVQRRNPYEAEAEQKKRGAPFRRVSILRGSPKLR